MRAAVICSALMSTTIVGVLSASGATLTLQQGAGGYTGTTIASAVKSEGAGAFSTSGYWYAYSTSNAKNLATVVGFDASSLPAGATVTSASLNMTFTGNVNYGNGTTTTWAVKDPGVEWKPGQVSYYFAEYDPNVNKWESTDSDPYGPGYNSDTGITMVNKPTVSTASISTGTTASFDVTSIVAGWAAGATNYGFGIVPIDGNPDANYFWAGPTEATQAYRPELVITYSVPEPASLGVLGIGATFMLRRRSK